MGGLLACRGLLCLCAVFGTLGLLLESVLEKMVLKWGCAKKRFLVWKRDVTRGELNFHPGEV